MFSGLNHYSKTCVKGPLKKTKKCFQDQLLLNADQKYCRILLISIKLPVVIKTFVLSIFEWQVLLYLVEEKVSYLRTHHSASNKAQTSDSSISS